MMKTVYIMGFAADISAKAAEAYKILVQKAQNPGYKEILQSLSVEEGKICALMGKTRRENVTEMILEPISGLRQEDYEVELKVVDLMEDADLLQAACTLEERGKKFFRDASAKVPLPEVGRIFRKIAQKKEENLAKLRGK
jgi:rubrerythrin